MDYGNSEVSAKVGTMNRDITQTEMMLNEVAELVKGIENRLSIVLSDESPRPEEVPNVQNPVQAKLFHVIQNLRSLKDRINL